MNIQLEQKDIARLNTLDNNRCRKCLNEFKEGDIVEKIGTRPSKYYHIECFNRY